MSDTPWQRALAALREPLAGRRDARGFVGSLRWLERALAERGANPACVRNVVYRDVGTARDKAALRDLLAELAAEVGADLDLPERPPVPADDAARLLGREKRLAHRRFLDDLRAGRVPRLVVVGAPGAGKTILIDSLACAVPGAVRLRLEGDLRPELERLAREAGLGARALALPLAVLNDADPYAVSGARQQDVTRPLVRALHERPLPALLVRVGPQAHLGGHALRLPDGASASPAAWVWHHLAAPLAAARQPLLLAVSDAADLPDGPGAGAPIVLPAPTLADARRFVRAKLPHLAPPAVERLVRAAGRDYDALGLLALLEAMGSEAGRDAAHADDAPPVREGPLADFLQALHVACPPEFPDADERLLAALLDREPAPGVERAFLEPAGPGRVRPTNARLVARLCPAPTDGARALHRRAAAHARAQGDEARALHHALRADDWADAVDLAREGALLEHAWDASESPDVPPGARAVLARRVVEHFAALGQYAHPALERARAELAASEDPEARVWAEVKATEALIDAARFAQARAALEHLRARAAGGPPEVRAELALGEAAFARWQGEANVASGFVREAEAHAALVAPDRPLQGKVRLWRGLVGKDLGDWEAATAALEGVRRDDLALGLHRARAAYQLGDLWMRLGQQGRARAAPSDAARELGAHGARAEEVSRARARLGSVLRRLGELERGKAAFRAAREAAPDPFTHARAASEATLLYAARGAADVALHLGNTAWRVFVDEKARPAEAAYRRARVAYRVGVAYLARGLGRPYLPPLRGAARDHPDLAHARALFARTLAEVPREDTDRAASLRLDLHLALALAEPDPDRAVAHARDAVGAARSPAHDLQARLHLAEALVRAGAPSRALAEVGRAHAAARRAARLGGAAALDEPGVEAWLALLEFETLAAEDPADALRALNDALARPDLAAFRANLLARAVEAAGEQVRAALVPGDWGLLAPQDAAREGRVFGAAFAGTGRDPAHPVAPGSAPRAETTSPSGD